jgi:hypothetical protein
MKLGVILVSLLFVALLSGGPVQASTRSKQLDAVTTWLAMRPVGVKCYGRDEKDAPWSYGAWGYVVKPVGQSKFAHLDVQICAGALDVNGDLPAWQRALGVSVVTHESYHLRRWGAAGNEAKVECQAIRHWKVVARRLGATEETVTELWPSALAAHYELAEFQNWMTGERPYYDPDCEVPPLFALDE